MPVITDFSHVKIDYVDDYGAHHTISQRKAVASGVGNTVTTASNPPRPTKWKLRHVMLATPPTGPVTNRKRVVIGNPASGLWTNPAASPVPIDGVLWKIQGRIAEARLVS